MEKKNKKNSVPNQQQPRTTVTKTNEQESPRKRTAKELKLSASTSSKSNFLKL